MSGVGVMRAHLRFATCAWRLRSVAAVAAARGCVAVDRLAVERPRRRAARRAGARRRARSRALAPGSALACLDAGAGDTVENACEKAVFASAQSTAAAVAYMDARLKLLSEAAALARQGDGRIWPRSPPPAAPSSSTVIGVAAHVLATRDGCTADKCAAFALVDDASALKANLRGPGLRPIRLALCRRLERAAPPPKPPAGGRSRRPCRRSPASRRCAPAAAAGRPIKPGEKWDFPSAASIPPVSIMNKEPPLPPGADASAQAPPAAPAAKAAAKRPQCRCRRVPPQTPAAASGAARPRANIGPTFRPGPDVQIRPDRQPRRDRLPHHPHRAPPRPAHHRGLFRRRRARAACARGRRGGRASARRRRRKAISPIDKLIAAAKAARADCIHPGYGFLSENADFAKACADAGIVFVGPPPAAIRAMGLKDRAKALMEKAGVPVVPGYHGERQEPKFLKEKAYELGYPVLIKAVAGGGGKGMRRVDKHADFDAALEAAQREAQSRLRRRPRADREICRAPAPHRGAGVRRPPRQRRPSVRARLLAAAPPSEGDRGGAGARHERRLARRDGRGRGRRRQGGGLRGRRHHRVHRRRRRRAESGRLLVHGDEHAAAGRASGHRSGHRPRSGRMAVARRRRRAAAAQAGPGDGSQATRSRRGSMPRIPRTASCRRPAS